MPWERARYMLDYSRHLVICYNVYQWMKDKHLNKSALNGLVGEGGQRSNVIMARRSGREFRFQSLLQLHWNNLAVRLPTVQHGLFNESRVSLQPTIKTNCYSSTRSGGNYN